MINFKYYPRTVSFFNFHGTNEINEKHILLGRVSERIFWWFSLPNEMHDNRFIIEKNKGRSQAKSAADHWQTLHHPLCFI